MILTIRFIRMQTEYCNEIDDDCDGFEDEDSPIGSNTYYQDIDADGFGDPDEIVLACTQPLARNQFG